MMGFRVSEEEAKLLDKFSRIIRTCKAGIISCEDY